MTFEFQTQISCICWSEYAPSRRAREVNVLNSSARGSSEEGTVLANR